MKPWEIADWFDEPWQTRPWSMLLPAWIRMQIAIKVYTDLHKAEEHFIQQLHTLFEDAAIRTQQLGICLTDFSDRAKEDNVLSVPDGHFRGYKIEKTRFGHVFADTGEPVSLTWKSRPCGHCGKHNTREDHDGCLGTVPGAVNACCGHGVPGEAYVQFDDGSELRGHAALDFLWLREGEEE